MKNIKHLLLKFLGICLFLFFMLFPELFFSFYDEENLMGPCFTYAVILMVSFIFFLIIKRIYLKEKKPFKLPLFNTTRKGDIITLVIGFTLVLWPTLSRGALILNSFYSNEIFIEGEVHGEYKYYKKKSRTHEVTVKDKSGKIYVFDCSLSNVEVFYYGKKFDRPMRKGWLGIIYSW